MANECSQISIDPFSVMLYLLMLTLCLFDMSFLFMVLFTVMPGGRWGTPGEDMWIYVSTVTLWVLQFKLTEPP